MNILVTYLEGFCKLSSYMKKQYFRRSGKTLIGLSEEQNLAKLAYSVNDV